MKNISTLNRIPYIDNIRILCVLILIPFHSAYIFNNLGEKFYINGTPSELLNAIDICIYPWWMTGLFVLAGMSTMYALRKRNISEYVLERVNRLLIPFIMALFIVVPPQCYFADKFHNEYTGNFFEHYKVFFSVSDFSGYDGKFTPGNAWFILYLFIFSIIFSPLFSWYKKRENKLQCDRIPLIILIVLGLFVPVSEEILNIGGKSLFQFAYCFLLGFFVFSDENVQIKLEKHSLFLGVMWIIAMILRQVAHSNEILWHGPLSYIAWYLVTCFGILGMLGVGRKYLNREFFFTKYMKRAEFAIFLIHQTIVVTIAYYIVQAISNPILAFGIITVGSFILTFAIYEILKRNKVTRYLFSIK